MKRVLIDLALSVGFKAEAIKKWRRRCFTCPVPCNRTKHAMPLEQFLARKGYDCGSHPHD